jgi:signal peptidase II
MSNADKAINDAASSRIAIWGPHSAFGLLFAIVALAADQLHKYWMLEIYRIAERGRVPVTSFFDLVMVWNPGISYGLLPQDSALGRYLLASFSALAVIALLLWMSNAVSRLGAFSLGLIIGGAIGNLIDRMIYGAVADFFSFHYAGFYWYVFNIADVAITVGVMGLILDWLKPSHTKVSKGV